AVNLLGVVPQLKTSSYRRNEIETLAHRLHLPDEIADAVADIPLLHKLRNPNIPDTIFSAVLASQRALVNANLREWTPDYLIQPDLSRYTGSEFHLVEEISDIGLEATEIAMPDLARKLGMAIQPFGCD
ncbi:MAG: hypothetical protein KAH54_06755, partial [Candidatus Sabulitectum sp.]|nr:hypothetical protein [Candidatus Sabulitectum sp.]